MLEYCWCKVRKITYFDLSSRRSNKTVDKRRIHDLLAESLANLNTVNISVGLNGESRKYYPADLNNFLESVEETIVRLLSGLGRGARHFDAHCGIAATKLD